MLRKRARSIQKDQQTGQNTSDGGSDTCLQSDLSGQRQKTSSFFNIPGVFVGLSPKGVLDCDSVRSPTSPLDFKLLSNLSTSFRFPKPSQDGHLKCWVCGKVGLGSIVDSLDDDGRTLPEKMIPTSTSKTILFGSQVRSKAPNSPTHARFCEAPKSLPENYPIFPHPNLRLSNLRKGSSDVLFEIGGDPLESDPCDKIQSFSLDSKRLGSQIHKLRDRNTDLEKNSCLKSESIRGPSVFGSIGGSPLAEDKPTIDQIPVDYGNGNGNVIAGSLSSTEIELSEDYTCVITHGPNPKTTHIFGDCVWECYPSGIVPGDKEKTSENGMLMPCSEKSVEIPPPESSCLSNDFLSYCYFCKKKLEEGQDIYMYRGEKAFCSWECRLEEIAMEEKEISIGECHEESPGYENGDTIFEKSLFVAI